MYRIIIFTLTVLFFQFGGIVFADIIYTWTDADGVKRYSNSQPPEDAENVQKIEEIQYEPGSDGQRREKFDRMAEDAGKDADRHFEEQAEKKTQAAEAKRQQQLDAQSQRDGEERAKLQKELDEIQGRALGPNFTTGMKENQIKQIQEKIDQLESNSN